MPTLAYFLLSLACHIVGLCSNIGLKAVFIVYIFPGTVRGLRSAYQCGVEEISVKWKTSKMATG